MSEIGRASPAASRPASSSSARVGFSPMSFCSAEGARIGVGADRGQHDAGLGDGAVRIEAKPRAGAGDGDVHLAPRREAQVFRGRARLRRRQQDRDEHLAGLQAGRAGPAEHLLARRPRAGRWPGDRRRARRGRCSAGTASAEGAALQMLPPRLARFWTCTPPIRLRRLGDGRIVGGDGRMPRHGRRGGRGADGDAAVAAARQSRSARGCA